MTDVDAIAQAVVDILRPLLEELATRAIGGTPQFMKASELAAAMSTSPASIKRWVRNGMPSHMVGDRGRRYLLSECIQWHGARVREAKRAGTSFRVLSRTR